MAMRAAGRAGVVGLLVIAAACGSGGSQAARTSPVPTDVAIAPSSPSTTGEVPAAAATTSSASPSQPPAETAEPTSLPAATVAAGDAPVVVPVVVPGDGLSTVPPQTSVPGSTTTLAPAAALVLRTNGLGQVAFGAEPEGVIAYVTSIVGSPTTDTGWIDPLSLGSCPGTEVRTVTWADLNLYFGDQSRLAIGRRHFFSYSLGPPSAGATIAPAGMVTVAGVGVGSTLADLRAAYPGLLVNPGDPVSQPSFEVSAGLGGLLTAADDAATVTAIQGGFGCGE